ncbi:MAG: hypothetical protein KDG50_08950 [Chromatiales bacterium]|nr:hypothetical protein [Chromatiales bacterium]
MATPIGVEPDSARSFRLFDLSTAPVHGSFCTTARVSRQDFRALHADSHAADPAAILADMKPHREASLHEH